MNLRAQSSFQAGDFARLEAALVPRITAAVDNATQEVLKVALQRVPVDTGELASSGGAESEWKGHAVTGSVSFTADHAVYVEMGTGIRGAESPGAGEGAVYSPTWPGMRAQPYLRPALDESKEAIKDCFAAEGFDT
jgi:hypothetical protein